MRIIPDRPVFLQRFPRFSSQQCGQKDGPAQCQSAIIGREIGRTKIAKKKVDKSSARESYSFVSMGPKSGGFR